jgi:repressor LexA
VTTPFQHHLYRVVAEYLNRYGVSPTYTEITTALGISTRSKSLITRGLRQLEKEGRLILKREGRRLLLALPNKHIQVLGKISAGLPIDALPDEQQLDVGYLLESDDRFALKVQGTSMIEEGILDGDFIICKKANTAREGDIVVALIDQQTTTVKSISFKIPNMITLIPANKELKPRAYVPDRILIQGVYIGLIRMQR